MASGLDGRPRVLTQPVDLPRFVHELRGRVGLTQEQFAARLGVTFPTINRWENGRAKPSPLGLKQLEGLVRELGEEGREFLATYAPAEDRG